MSVGGGPLGDHFLAVVFELEEGRFTGGFEEKLAQNMVFLW